MTRRRGEESKGKRPILPLISSLNVLQSPEHPKRFTELSREEKREGGDRGYLGERNDDQKGREQSSQYHTPK